MRKIGFLIYPGYSPMGFAVSTAFEVANLHLGEPAYEIAMVSVTGGPVRTSQGFEVLTRAVGEGPYDTLIFAGGMEAPLPEIVALARRAPDLARRIASTCLATFILAEAGLLDGRRATTHWMRARDLQSHFPAIRVQEDRIFVTDGPISTSAGMTAGIDLALALIEDDLGPDMARKVARKLVLYHRRAGGQSQFSSLLELEPKSDRIQAVMTYAKGNLARRLSVEDLAEIARLSPRQFSRAFHGETGQSPAKAIESLRLEEARNLIETSALSVDEIARATGFSDRERMRRAFLRAYGQPPLAIRRLTGLPEPA